MIAALIPARIGSVRIPRKNIRDFHGKPIIAYSIETAFETKLFDDVYVTTDDLEIAKIAGEYGAKVLMRGPEWSKDTVGPVDLARHHLKHMGHPDHVCILYATAPMMTALSIKEGWIVMNSERQPAFCVSIGVEPLHDAAQFIWCERSALREGIDEFGAWTTFMRIKPETDCDINTPEDWQRAEEMYARLYEPA